MPPQDAFLDVEQLRCWRAAEAHAGVEQSQNERQREAALPSGPPPVPTDGQEFMPAQSFLGAVDGFVFGTRGAQLGYHRDAVPPQQWKLQLNELVQPTGGEARACSPASQTGTPAARRRTPSGIRTHTNLLHPNAGQISSPPHSNTPFQIH